MKVFSDAITEFSKVVVGSWTIHWAWEVFGADRVRSAVSVRVTRVVRAVCMEGRCARVVTRRWLCTSALDATRSRRVERLEDCARPFKMGEQVRFEGTESVALALTVSANPPGYGARPALLCPRSVWLLAPA
jgi:hypothetical protein